MRGGGGSTLRLATFCIFAAIHWQNSSFSRNSMPFLGCGFVKFSLRPARTSPLRSMKNIYNYYNISYAYVSSLLSGILPCESIEEGIATAGTCEVVERVGEGEGEGWQFAKPYPA